MKTVFISYAHADSDFVDRLTMDLQESRIPATYDKWALKVGDSIGMRIAELIAESSAIIPVLSHSSVNSHWVQKEIALALMHEVNSNLKILPARIDDCEPPFALADKLYADFTDLYDFGLRSLVDGLRDDSRGAEGLGPDRLEAWLNANDLQKIRAAIRTRPDCLDRFMDQHWNVSEALHVDPGLRSVPDAILVNGQSSRYTITLVFLEDIALSEDDLRESIQKTKQALAEFRAHAERLLGALALNMRSRYGARQISNSDRPGHREFRALLFSGRRAAYTEDFDRLRHEAYRSSNKSIDIASYDRLLSAIC